MFTMLWQNKTKQMRTCSSLVIIEMKLINFFILAIQQEKIPILRENTN